MVVLTLHRDTPLSTEEIRLLPPGCYPVLGAGDTVARANLALPVAHIARYAAELARAIPDADFVAEERPTVRGARLLEAGALEEPYWAYTPPLAFRSEPPGAATLAEGPGAVAADSPLTGPEDAPEPPQTLPDTPETIDFASLVARVQNHQRSDPLADVGPAPEPEPAPEPAPEPIAVDPQKMDLTALFSLAQPGPAPKPTPQPAEEKPASGKAQVPSQIMDMFRSIRAQEDHEGVPVLKVDGLQAPSAPAPAPIPSAGVERTVRRKMSLSELVSRMRAATEPEPPPASAPQEEAPGPAASVSAPEISAFWEKAQAGDVEGAEQAARADGLSEADHGHVASLFTSEEPAQVALGLRVSRLAPWPGAARLSRRLLHHPEPAVRAEVARTLAALSGLEAEADLLILSRDLDRSVSQAANTALRHLRKRSRF